MSEYSNDPCVEQIMQGVHNFNSRGAEGKAERNVECDRLLLKFTQNCSFTTSKTNAILFAFADTTASLIQAIESYRNGYFDASMVMIRNSIDASTFLSICYTISLKAGTTQLQSLNPIDSILSYKKFKKWKKRKKAIMEKQFLSSDEIDRLFKIREEGNFSAHIYEKKRDNFNGVIEAALEGKRTFGDPMPKQFTTEAENKSHLLDSVNLLMKLHENYVSLYGVK